MQLSVCSKQSALARKTLMTSVKYLAKKLLRSSGSFVILRIKEPETASLYLGFYKLFFGDFNPTAIYAASRPLSTCRYWRISASLNFFTRITHSMSGCFRV